jgi:hypothetical protein
MQGPSPLHFKSDNKNKIIGNSIKHRQTIFNSLKIYHGVSGMIIKREDAHLILFFVQKNLPLVISSPFYPFLKMLRIKLSTLLV